jgi:hypothetical protein
MKSSDSAGSRSWQSASFPGSDAISMTPFAARQLAGFARGFTRQRGLDTLVMMSFASCGCSSIHCAEAARQSAFDDRAHFELTSLSFVCDENFGSGTLTETTQVKPSRVIAGESILSFFVKPAFSSAYLLITRVSARGSRQVRAAVALRDVVGEAHHVFMVGESFHCIATSTVIPSFSSLMRTA